MSITPDKSVVAPGEVFSIALTVESSLAVNVFSGELQFDPTMLEVVSIDYNTSVADLWAETPWYNNGAGTINFGGGTTQSGGFVGTAGLLTVQFKTKQEGESVLRLDNPQILRYDGLGTPSEIAAPIDTIITVTDKSVPNLVSRKTDDIRFLVATKVPNTDLNNDGAQTLSDVRILVSQLGTTNPQYDLNLDGSVNLEDLRILLAVE
jgi:hypothetical protein